MMHTEKHPIEIEFTIVDRIVEYSKLQNRMSGLKISRRIMGEEVI